MLLKKSFSIREVLIYLQLKPADGNYKTIQKVIKDNQISTTHFKGRGWNKGKTFQPKRELSEYLNNTQTIQSYKLKKTSFKR